MKDEALKLALKALELSSVTVDSFGVQRKTQEAITAIKQALAAPVQEPVVFKQFLSDVHTAAGLVMYGKQCKALGERLSEGVMRYYITTPPAAQRQWVGLTEDEIEECASYGYRYDVVAVTEDKLKEKNSD
jgi:hypothetical protein